MIRRKQKKTREKLRALQAIRFRYVASGLCDVKLIPEFWDGT